MRRWGMSKGVFHSKGTKRGVFQALGGQARSDRACKVENSIPPRRRKNVSERTKGGMSGKKWLREENI